MIHEAWFMFKGIDSRKMGVIVTAMPDTVRPERRMENISIAGRSGSLHIDEETYDSYDRTMECAIKKRARIDEITAWLVGSGDMIFSTEPDKVYKVTISNKLSISQMMRAFQKFMVTMDTQPFKYNVNAMNDKKILTEPTVIKSRGTVPAESIITIYGTGDITFILNGVEYPLYSVNNHITIDSEMMEVFDGKESQNNKYGTTEFPYLKVGTNDIRWTGNVEKVEIIPKWRWL